MADMLDGAAVRAVAELQKAVMATFQTDDGRTLSTVPLLNPPGPPDEPKPAFLAFSTLSSFADFVKDRVEAKYLDNHGPQFVHADSQARVSYWTTAFGPNHQRTLVARCDAIVPAAFKYDDFMDPESFNIGVQTHFVDNAGRAAILHITGTAKDEKVVTLDDDGVSQKIVASKGLSLRANVVAPNPVTLAPRRSFAEIVQPESPFVFRARGGGDGELPAFALFEADGGAWRLTAIERIVAYLRERIGGDTKVYG